MDIIIVDDAQTAIDALAKKLKNYPNVTVAGFANNGKDGLELLKTTHAEVVFLDVEMPDMTGIDFLGRMKDEGCKDTLAVVYTAYGTYTLPALRNKAFDFLMKPIDGNELETVMARLEEELEDIRVEREQLKGKDDKNIDIDDEETDDDCCRERAVTSALKKKDNKLLLYTNAVDFRLVEIQDICVFQYNHDLRVWEVVATGCDTPIRLKRCANKDILMALDENFVQVNQKYIINIKYLMEVRDNQCYFFPPFDGIQYIKIGRMYRRKLIKRFSTI